MTSNERAEQLLRLFQVEPGEIIEAFKELRGKKLTLKQLKQIRDFYVATKDELEKVENEIATRIAKGETDDGDSF
jgi:hypothetical protein